MITSAHISHDNTMRWELQRIWGYGAIDKPWRICLFVMLNPSTADATEDDATIRRCMAFGKAWGYDGVRVVNLVAFRATQPKDMLAWFLKRSTLELSAHLNYTLTASRAADVAMVCCAFGRVPVRMRKHAETVVDALALRRNVFAIKLNGDGSPAHPLYLKGNLTPVMYKPITFQRSAA
jgi:hypothetical protein